MITFSISCVVFAKSAMKFCIRKVFRTSFSPYSNSSSNWNDCLMFLWVISFWWYLHIFTLNDRSSKWGSAVIISRDHKWLKKSITIVIIFNIETFDALRHVSVFSIILISWNNHIVTVCLDPRIVLLILHSCHMDHWFKCEQKMFCFHKSVILLSETHVICPCYYTVGRCMYKLLIWLKTILLLLE